MNLIIIVLMSCFCSEEIVKYTSETDIFISLLHIESEIESVGIWYNKKLLGKLTDTSSYTYNFQYEGVDDNIYNVRYIKSEKKIIVHFEAAKTDVSGNMKGVTTEIDLKIGYRITIKFNGPCFKQMADYIMSIFKKGKNSNEYEKDPVPDYKYCELPFELPKISSGNQLSKLHKIKCRKKVVNPLDDLVLPVKLGVYLDPISDSEPDSEPDSDEELILRKGLNDEDKLLLNQ